MNRVELVYELTFHVTCYVVQILCGVILFDVMAQVSFGIIRKLWMFG